VLRLWYNLPVMPIISVKNLSVTLDDEPILEDLSFDLERGEALAVIGPNGAGKTVFLKALLDAVPYHGSIRFAPHTRLGYVPQKIDADRHLPLTFHNLLAAKASIDRLSQRQIDEVLNEVGVPKTLLNTPVGHLSGGQFQKALIAFALLGKPDVIIFDEPTASIDEPREEQMYELMHRLQDKFGITIIVVSHDLSFVYRYATKVLCLNRRGLCFGAPREVLDPDMLDRLYGAHKYYHHMHPHDES
jgi:zinc transport system ATP-binding protein